MEILIDEIYYCWSQDGRWAYICLVKRRQNTYHVCDLLDFKDQSRKYPNNDWEFIRGDREFRVATLEERNIFNKAFDLPLEVEEIEEEVIIPKELINTKLAKFLEI